MSRGYKHDNVSVHLMMYHYVWIPKRRKKVLIGDVAKRLKVLIKQKSDDIGCEIIQLRVLPDHVHLFIRGNPILSPNGIIMQIKGYTSRILRQEFKQLLKLPSLWTRSYFLSTAGNVSHDVIEKYIREQDAKD
jgi:putative transposase